ncbi:MAG TPA: TrkH family potassium uptake protein [Firmicutes bacterium]|nr:TrkH family potassium uptake protein [Bacillota bacterium]
MLVPLGTALLFAEFNSALDFVTGACLSLAVGYALLLSCEGPDGAPGPLEWVHGMVTAAFSWLLCMCLAAVPYFASGHYDSFLDAMFDVMSGFTTTGLVLIKDLDHVPVSLNMWRHLLTYIGGQGMIVLALSFLIRAQPGAVSVYVGEGKDEKLLPNVVHTARAIWVISLVYLAVGTGVLWIVGMGIGLTPLRALLHGLWVFMAAWSTGGFAPQSQNILYYHSLPYELATIVFFVAGSLNFALHYAVWTGNRREIYRNIETITFATTSTALSLLAVWGLARSGTYAGVTELFRKGYYLLVSGHTTTGFMSVYARQIEYEWGPIPILAITIAMLLGGSACSTAGGFKAIRVGVITKAILQDIKRMALPGSAVLTDKFHHVRDVIMEDKQIRVAMTIVILYIITFAIVTAAGAAAGYSLTDSAFEAASATGNVGLSIGVTDPSMPAFLKIVYIVAMWAGRLEFASVLGLVSFIAAVIRGR